MAAEVARGTTMAAAAAVAEPQLEQALQAQLAEPVALLLVLGARQAPQRLTTAAVAAVAQIPAVALTWAAVAAAVGNLAPSEWAAILGVLLAAVVVEPHLVVEQVPQLLVASLAMLEQLMR